MGELGAVSRVRRRLQAAEPSFAIAPVLLASYRQEKGQSIRGMAKAFADYRSFFLPIASSMRRGTIPRSSRTPRHSRAAFERTGRRRSLEGYSESTCPGETGFLRLPADPARRDQLRSGFRRRASSTRTIVGQELLGRDRPRLWRIGW